MKKYIVSHEISLHIKKEKKLKYIYFFTVSDILPFLFLTTFKRTLVGVYITGHNRFKKGNPCFSIHIYLEKMGPMIVLLLNSTFFFYSPFSALGHTWSPRGLKIPYDIDYRCHFSEHNRILNDFDLKGDFKVKMTPNLKVFFSSRDPYLKTWKYLFDFQKKINL